MLKRNVKLGLILSAACLSQAGATAGELTLFSDSGFQGRQVTVRDATRSLDALGFNDRSASMVIRSGRWEVCMHADYRDCQVMEPGQYRQLDRMTNQISSVREVGGGEYDERRERRDERLERREERFDRRDERIDNRRDDNRNDYRNDYRNDNRNDNRNDYRAGSWNGNGADQSAPVILFERSGMRGRALPLRGDVSNLTSFGFNDRAQSMVVQNGSWEFCMDKNFGGQCRVYEPGEYRNIDRGLFRAITSARMVANDDGRGRGNGRGRDHGRDGVELFSTPGFGGERIQVSSEVRSLEQVNFNDRAASLVVHNGQWEFCQHADFRGQCMTYGPGRHERLGNLDFQISSIRRVR